MIELAIYDMDRTITRRATYTPFLIHAAAKISPWRLALLPLSALAMLGYAVRLIDRRRHLSERIGYLNASTLPPAGSRGKAPPEFLSWCV